MKKKLNKKRKTYYFFIYELCPWFLYLLGELLGQKFARFIGLKTRYLCVMDWRNRTLRGVSDLETNRKWAKCLFKRFQEDPSYLARVEKNYYQKMKDLYNYLKKIYQSNLKKKSNQELWQYLDGFRQRFDSMYLWGWIPNALEGQEGFFFQYLKDKISQKLKQLGKAEKTAEYLTTLITSNLIIPRQKEEQSFLKIIGEIEKNSQLGKLFKKDITKIKKELPSLAAGLDKKINQHQEEFAWLLFKYEGPEWDKTYLLGLIKDFLKQGKTVQEKLKELNHRKEELLSNQKKFAREIQLEEDKELSFFINLSRRFMHFKEHQKDYLFMCYYYLDKLVKEAASRLYLSPSQFRHLLHEEMKEALLKKKYDSDCLNERIKHCLLMIETGEKTKIFSGKEAEKLARKYIPPLPKPKIFQGQSAHEGFVKGRVKIIQETKDIAKMKKGDILVTTRTNPNLLPAMRKAEAIIADIGGVTSHAAIISRELKIPCVVGLEFASLVLRDGDLVEVDADKGYVRLIKRTARSQ